MSFLALESCDSIPSSCSLTTFILARREKRSNRPLCMDLFVPMLLISSIYVGQKHYSDSLCLEAIQFDPLREKLSSLKGTILEKDKVLFLSNQRHWHNTLLITKSEVTSKALHTRHSYLLHSPKSSTITTSPYQLRTHLEVSRPLNRKY